jgi:predicted unusual protein kinase regulating ubiquinone biosynthesis (AarF/ABC1/UbiB family)
VVRALPFQLPENFLLIVRAMSLTSGVCSSLNPAFNLWDSVEPYASQLLREERGNLAQDVGSQALDIAGIAWRLPKRLDGLVSRFEDGTVAVASPALERRVARLERSVGRVVSAVLFGALLIAGAVLRVEDAVLGTVLMTASVLPMLHALFAGRRGGDSAATG